MVTSVADKRRLPDHSVYTGQVLDRMSIPRVAPRDVTDEAVLLDVREADEWQAGHAPGARHVPMMQVPQRLADLPTDRDLVVICRVGNRSAQVVAYLFANGWDRVHNLDGGMYAWAAAGLPLVSEDGHAARVL